MSASAKNVHAFAAVLTLEEPAVAEIEEVQLPVPLPRPTFDFHEIPALDGFPKGRPEHLAYTNRKVIVARSYVDGPYDPSPKDHSGHGTAAAMIAAGVRNAGPAGTIVGVAPKAYLGNYKIGGSPEALDTATTEVLVKALEDALSDGMDVVALSVGAPFWYGPLAHDCGQTPCH